MAKKIYTINIAFEGESQPIYQRYVGDGEVLKIGEKIVVPVGKHGQTIGTVVETNELDDDSISLNSILPIIHKATMSEKLSWSARCDKLAEAINR